MPIPLFKNALPLITFLSIILIGTASYWIYTRIQADIRSEVANSLDTVLDTTHQAVRSWLKEHRAAANIWANTRTVHEATKELLIIDRDKQTLATSAAQARLRTWLESVHLVKGYQGYFIIAPDNTNLASSRDQNIGMETLLSKQETFLQKIRAGHTAVSLPEKSDVSLPDKEGTLRVNLPTMFVGAPVKDKFGKVLAIFAFRINPAEDFTAILQQGRIGKTGETYAFDKWGRLISNSRFDEQLRELGLISATEEAILNIKLHDPGITLGQGQASDIDKEQQAFTRMAASAIAGESGSDLTGYRDYRGTTVVGAWLWDDELGFGITTEIDTAEAYQTLRTTRYTIVTFTLLLILLTIGMAVIYINSISRKRAQQALVESEARLAKFFEASFEGIFLHENGKILDVNPATTSVFGYDPEETIGRNLLEFVAPESRDLVKAHMAAGHEGPYEVDIVRIDGSAVTFEIRAKTIELEGRSVRVVGLRDITERKHAEEALRKAHHELEKRVQERTAELHEGNISWQALLAATVNSVFVINSNGVCLDANEAGAKRLGLDIPGIRGNNLLDLMPQEVAQNRRVFLEKVIETKKELRFEDVCEGIYFDTVIYPVFDATAEVEKLIVIASDITERRQAEEKTLDLLQQNRDLTKRMFQVQEQERQHLARELHDEFGQWLTAIQLNTQNITNLIGKQSANIDASIEAIAHSTKQIHQGIRRMIHSLRPALLDDLGLVDSLRELVVQWQEHNPSIKCGLSLNGELDDLGENLNILIYRLAQESLTNVAKHAQASHVEVQLQRNQIDNEKADRLILTITDDGKGFNPGMTANGIGLPGMRERVLASGGTFSVNAAGSGNCLNGTCIVVELFINTEYG